MKLIFTSISKMGLGKPTILNVQVFGAVYGPAGSWHLTFSKKNLEATVEGNGLLYRVMIDKFLWPEFIGIDLEGVHF